MIFTPYLELSPQYDENQEIATNSYLRDGRILYLMGSTILCKYDISDPENPKLLKKADITKESQSDFIRKGCAHCTSMVDLGKYLALSLRDSSGGVTNMADGTIVGRISILNKETLAPVRELDFENKVTNITRYKDLLIVSLHFHGFYIYKLTEDEEILTCLYRHIEIEKPQRTRTREFQNSAVFEKAAGKINIAFASYRYCISTYTYDLEENTVTPCCELSPEAIPHMKDAQSVEKNKVFGLAAKGNFVYGGVSPGNHLFREQYKRVDWSRFDQRGIVYGPHDRLIEEHYHLPLPDADKPKFIGVIAGDPAPSFLCVAKDYLLFNLDCQGLGIAKIEADGRLTYMGRALEDPCGRQLTYRLHFDGEFLCASYKMPIPDGKNPPVFRMFEMEN